MPIAPSGQREPPLGKAANAARSWQWNEADARSGFGDNLSPGAHRPVQRAAYSWPRPARTGISARRRRHDRPPPGRVENVRRPWDARSAVLADAERGGANRRARLVLHGIHFALTLLANWPVAVRPSFGLR